MKRNKIHLVFGFWCILFTCIQLEVSGVSLLEDLKKAVAPETLSEEQLDFFSKYFANYQSRNQKLWQNREQPKDSLLMQSIRLSEERLQTIQTHLTAAQYRNYLAFKAKRMQENQVETSKIQLDLLKKQIAPETLSEEQEGQLNAFLLKRCQKSDSIYDVYRTKPYTRAYHQTMLTFGPYTERGMQRLLTGSQYEKWQKATEAINARAINSLKKNEAKREAEQ